ncbi:unnamed protein product [Nesidiocoris tenuis]|uniref:CAP-Gly domain-containing protein n=1 Tax=Nesidiocoris tenuis TaxID=355587 RepID=A0A6H5GI18_9HEMI|nr:unnamed protein product [Nesidiocoris tenuis]
MKDGGTSAAQQAFRHQAAFENRSAVLLCPPQASCSSSNVEIRGLDNKSEHVRWMLISGLELRLTRVGVPVFGISSPANRGLARGTQQKSVGSCSSPRVWAKIRSFLRGSSDAPLKLVSQSLTFVSHASALQPSYVIRVNGSIVIVLKSRIGTELQKKLFLIHIYSESLPEQVSHWRTQEGKKTGPHTGSSMRTIFFFYEHCFNTSRQVESHATVPGPPRHRIQWRTGHGASGSVRKLSDDLIKTRINGVGIIGFGGSGTDFATSLMAKNEEKRTTRKNDGAVGNTRYFQCEPKKGIFSKLTRLTRSPLSLPETSGSTPQTPVPSTPLGSPPSSIKGSSSSRTTPPPPAMVSPPSPAPTGELKIGERVIVMSQQGSKAGVLRFKGPTSFAAGEWCGVELDDPLGKNDGTVEGVRRPSLARLHRRLPRPNRQHRHDPRSSCLNEEVNIGKITPSSNQKNEEKVIELEQALLIEQAKYDSLLEKASESESRLSILLNEFEKLQKDKHEMEKVLKQELIDTMDRANQMAKNYNEADDNLEKVKLELEAFKAQVHDSASEESAKIQNDLQAVCEQKNELQTRLGNLEVIRSELLKTVEGKDEDLSRLSAELAALQSKFAELQVQQSDSQKLIESQRSAFDELKKKFDEKSAECLDLVAKFDSTSSELHESQRLVASQLETIHNLKTEIENNKSATSSQMDELTRALELEVAKVSNELAQCLDRLKEKESELENVKLSCKELNGKVSSLQSTCDSLNEAVRQKADQLAEFEALVGSKDRNIEELRQNLSSAQDGSSKAVENLNSRIQELTSALEHERAESKAKEAKANSELAQNADLLRAKESELENVRLSSKELSEKVNSLQSDCETLGGNLRQKDAELAEMKDLVNVRDRNVEELKQNLALAQDGSSKAVENLNSRIQELTSALEQERAESKAKESKISNELAQNANELRAKISEFEKLRISLEESNEKLKTLQSNFDSLNNTLRQKDAELSALKDSLAVKDQNIDELKHNLALAQDGSSKAVENLNSRVQELTSILEQERAESKAKEAKVSNELAVSVDRLKASESELEKMKNSCKELNGKVNSMQDDCESLRKTVEQKDAKLAELEDSVATGDRNIEELKQNLALAQDCSSKTVDGLNSRIQELTNTLERERAEFAIKETKASNDLAQSSNELKVKESELEKVTSTCEELKGKVDSLRSECDTYDKTVSEKSAKLAELEALVASKDRKIDELNENLASSRDGSSKAAEDLKTRIQELTTALDEERAQSKAKEAKIGGELAQTLGQLKAKESELEKASFTSKELFERVNSLRSDIKTLNQTVQQKDAELKELEDSIASKDDNIEELRRTLTSAQDDSNLAVENLNCRIQELTSALERERADSKAKEASNQESMIVLEQRIENFETALSLSSQTIDALKASQSEKEAQLVKFEKHALSVETELKEKIFQLERRLSEANIVLELSQVEDDAEIAKMKENETLLEAQLKTKDDELLKLSAELAKYEEDLKNANVTAKETSEALTSELESLKRKSEESEATMNTLNKTLRKYESEIKVKGSRVTELETMVESLEGELARMKSRSEADSSSKADLEQEISRIADTKSKIEQERTRLTASLEDRQEEISRYKQLLETEVSNRAASAAEFAKVELRMNMIREEKVNLEEKVKALQDEISRLKSNPTIAVDNAGKKATDDEPRDDNPEPNNWAEEKELAESQINFLNSIIVDMKKKNDELSAKLATVDTANGEQVEKKSKKWLPACSAISATCSTSMTPKTAQRRPARTPHLRTWNLGLGTKSAPGSSKRGRTAAYAKVSDYLLSFWKYPYPVEGPRGHAPNEVLRNSFCLSLMWRIEAMIYDHTERRLDRAQCKMRMLRLRTPQAGISMALGQHSASSSQSSLGIRTLFKRIYSLFRTADFSRHAAIRPVFRTSWFREWRICCIVDSSDWLRPVGFVPSDCARF